MKKKSLTATVIAVAASLLLAGCGGGIKNGEGGPEGTDWPMYGGSTARLGYSPESLAPPFELKWSAGTGRIEGGAAVAEERACVADTGGTVHCFEAESGKVDWTFQADGPVRGQTPLIYDTRVFVGSAGGTFYCLNFLGGLRLWEKNLGTGSFSSPLGDGGKVYVSHGNRIICFEARKGTEVFIYASSGAGSITAPALVQGRLYFGTDKGSVVCLDASSGFLIWESGAAAGAGVTTTPVITGTNLYFATSDNHLWCLGLQRGELVWKNHIQQKMTSPPAISGSTLVIGTGDAASLAPGVVWCLDAANGGLRWEYETDFNSPLQVSLTDQYACVHNGLVLELAGGTAVTSLMVDGNPYAPPVPYAGRLYVCDAEGGLNCLGP